MIIAIDFDETLFPTLEEVIKIYNYRHNAELMLEQIISYNLYECLDAHIANELIEIFTEEYVYHSLQPYIGATKAVKMLIDHGHNIFVATASDLKNMEWKEKLLLKYFPFVPKNNLIRIHNKALLNVDVMVEDNLENLIHTNAERICFNQKWNYDERKDYVYGLHRAYNWVDIIDIINEIERKEQEWEKE